MGYLIEFLKQFEVSISTHLKLMLVVSRFLEVERLLPVVEGPLLEVEGVKTVHIPRAVEVEGRHQRHNLFHYLSFSLFSVRYLSLSLFSTNCSYVLLSC